MKKFDLNIETILEAWDVHDAIREIIANAIDEEILSGTKEMEIFEEDNKWHIRDYGRGLNYQHFTQNEDDEKIANEDKVIGKFGVGLKDALAVFDRKKVDVKIISKHAMITLGKAPKEDFPDKETLHAFFSESPNPSFEGTEFILDGVSDEEMELAKDFFLRFSDETLLEETTYGGVYKRLDGETAKIYVQGVRVAEEDNYLFSYNITSLTSKMRKALNRERSNVGRVAYSGRVKSILLDSNSKEVAELLVDDLERYSEGTVHEELKYIDIQVHACKLLNSQDNVVFVTPEEFESDRYMIDSAKEDGYRVVHIPLSLKEKIRGDTDDSGNPIRDLDQYTVEYNQSFEYEFVEENELNDSEMKVFNERQKILDMIGGKPSQVKEIIISNTMRPDLVTMQETNGIWEGNHERIIIHRDQLQNLSDFAGTLLHEVAHATSGASDGDRDFERELTKFLGLVTEKGIFVEK